ncbi:MAG TPA: hypothetical protein VFX68_07805 [Sulfuricurvum sp.]|nr:hypothetical protein [Sulfuricurvum sp.]
MSRIAVVFLVSMGFLYSAQTQDSPSSPDNVQGKSVYVPSAPSVDMVEEGCVQKEDQNRTESGSGQ